jgi:hypothetical protein
MLVCVWRACMRRSPGCPGAGRLLCRCLVFVTRVDRTNAQFIQHAQLCTVSFLGVNWSMGQRQQAKAASPTIIAVFRYRSFILVVNRTCVGTYVENDSKCDLATELRSMSDINRTLDTYVLRCSRMIYKYHFLAQYKELRPPPLELELYRASPELALKRGGHRSQLQKNAPPNSASHV